jgi:hypothetical protein
MIELKEEVILNAIQKAPRDAKWEEYALKAEEGVDGFTWDGPYIFHNGQIFIPDIQNLKLLILQSQHDHKLHGHLGIR